MYVNFWPQLYIWTNSYNNFSVTTYLIVMEELVLADAES